MKARTDKLYFKFGIRQKMIVVLLCVLTIALSTTGWLTIRQYNDSVFRETQKRGDELARFVAESLVFSVVGYDYHTVQLLLDTLVDNQDIIYAEVKNDRDNVMGSAGTFTPSANTKRFEREIVFDEQTIGHLTVGLDQTRIVNELEEQKSALIKRELFIVFFIAIGEFLALSYIIVRPVTIISRSLRAEEDSQKTRDIPLDSNDEFGGLARQFNDIRAQLGDANDKLQSRIDLADSKLKETNTQLRAQSDELRRMNEELHRLSITDPLTGLYNRREFEDRVSSEVLLSLRHREANSFLIIDVDHFKKINDTYGHVAGDHVLRSIANLLAENLRRSDILCRFGGEEFICLCRRASKTQAMLIGEKIRSSVENGRIIAGTENITVTVSIGIASIPGNQEGSYTMEELIDQADSALYYSKTKGRNRVTHHDHVLHVSHSTDA